MRIAIVTETFLPKMDGIVRMLTEFLAYLRRHDHQALILTPGRGAANHDRFPVERVRGLRWRLYPGLTVAGPAPHLAATLRRWQPDLVHLAGPAVLGAQAAGIGRLLGLPIAAHFQTDLARYARLHGLGILQPVAWHYLRAIHHLADRTYCPTPTVRRELQAQGFRDLALCARGVDADGFHPRYRSAALRAQVRGDAAETAPLLAYVGRLSPEKNLEALVAVAQARPQLPLLIVGDGPARPALEATLCGHRVHFTGELRGPDLATAYASADLLLCPSLTETFCQVAQEGMASGLPVLGFRAGGVQDVVRHGETGLLSSPGDAGAWLAAVDTLTNDPALRRRYATRAREVAEGRTWHAVFDRLMGDYQELSATRRVRPALFTRGQRVAPTRH